jgi:hypothetical protein
VIDKTGLKGRFDFTLEWARDPRGLAASDSPAPAAPAGPTPIEALRDQPGLKPEPTKTALPILVIERAPSLFRILRMKPLQSPKTTLPSESTATLIGFVRNAPATPSPAIVDIVYCCPNSGTQEVSPCMQFAV